MRFWAVCKREYVQAVRTKSFLVMTLVAPFLMAALVLIPALLTTHGVGEKHVLVIDGTRKLAPMVVAIALPKEVDEMPQASGLVATLHIETEETDSTDAALAAALPRLKLEREDRLDGILVIPQDVVDKTPDKASYYARSASDLLVPRRLERAVNRAIMRERWRARGVAEADLERVEKRVTVETVRVSKEGQARSGGELDYIVGFGFVALLFIPILLYGQSIMLGIVQEKSDRVVEVLLSSLSAMDLLSGKILGLAAVGLTQIAVWITMGTTLARVVGTESTLDISRFLRAGVFGYFAVFFLLGYLIQVCVYAMGGAIANSEREARQVIMPVAMAMTIPWFMVMPILTNPESLMSIILSMIPIFTPITMFMRVLVSEPPAWQVGLSIVATIGTVWLLFRLTAKVFRIGILSYGKKPTLAELWTWVRHA